MFVRGCVLTVNWSLSSLPRTRPAAASCEVNRVLLYTVNSRLFMGDYLCWGLSVLGAGRLFPVLLLVGQASLGFASWCQRDSLMTWPHQDPASSEEGTVMQIYLFICVSLHCSLCGPYIVSASKRQNETEILTSPVLLSAARTSSAVLCRAPLTAALYSRKVLLPLTVVSQFLAWWLRNTDWSSSAQEGTHLVLVVF